MTVSYTHLAENSDYVVVDRVTKRFGEEMVLKETTMTMKRGKVYGIVGNNGSGKTVLMKCCLLYTSRCV